MYRGFSIYDFCAFFITVGLILSIYVRKLWKDRTNNIFLVCLFAALFAIIQNSLFVKIVSLSLTPTRCNLAIFLRILYFISLLLVMVGTYIYMLSTMGLLHLITSKKHNVYKKTLVFLFAVPFLYILISIPNEWLFSITVENGYVINYGTHLFYLFIIVVLCFGGITAVIYKKYLTRTKLLDCLILYPINIISVFYQVFQPDYSFVMFVIVMSFYVISITTQRPENLINPILDAKTSSSFYGDTESLYITEQPAIYLFVKIVNHSQIKKYIGEKAYIRFLRNVSDKIHEIINSYKFQLNFYYLEDSEYCIAFSESKFKYADNIAREISELFINEYKFEKFKVFPDVRLCVVSIPDDINNYDYLTYFAKVFHNIVPVEKTPIYLRNIADDKDFLVKNDIERIIKNGLEKSAFQVLYQPIYNVEKNIFDSVEALVRLNDEVYGEIETKLFISSSEVRGFIIQIGDIVLKKVFEFIGSEEFKKCGLKNVAVNLTLAQCMESNFCEKILSMMNEYGIQNNQIRFEITENMEGYNSSVIEENLLKLREAGINFALDDYGTGYSNIKHVLQLPVDVVKLDKSFVQGMEDSQMKIIVNDTVAMLKKLNKQILVEGVESKDVLEYFLQLNCDYVQGYLFSKPLPKEELFTFLKDYKY